ncbi:hypothetical protein C8J57DRAFT_1708647 [Mycena rebaudengoi]|nr:hypothetical protein C8J57DRAFT_1708647 [Mycena rebaudengoi]
MDSLAILQALSTRSGDFERFIKKFIQESEANILDIDAKVALLNSQIRDLLCLRELERGKIATLRAVIVPIRKLPTELLTRIFALSVDSPQDALCVSQVSAYWRRVAHSTPLLWTVPVILQPTIKPSETYLSSTKAWIERSSPLLIPIELESSLCRCDLLPLMEVLLSASSRWKRFAAPTCVLPSLIYLPADTFANLEEVAFHGYGEGRSPSTRKFRHYLPAPRLRNATIYAVDVVELPWRQLSTLEIVNTAELYRRGPESIPPSRPRKALSLLKTLKASFTTASMDAVAIFPFFDSLSLPALERLTLRVEPCIPWPAQSFLQFQQQSPLLQSLTLSDVALTSTDLTAALDDQLIAALQLCDSDLSPLAPKLTTLCADAPQACFSESVLERTIRSRCWPATQVFTVPPRLARLEIVYLYFHETPFSAGFSRNMQECMDQGLDLDYFAVDDRDAH